MYKVTYLGDVNTFIMCKNVLPAYNSAKIIKIKRVFQSYDHKCAAILFMNHHVYCPQRTTMSKSGSSADKIGSQ